MLSDNAFPINEQARKKDKTTSTAWEWTKFLAMLILVFIFFRFVVNFTIVSGDSMNPTLTDRDLMLSTEVFYEVERGDVIIFENYDGFNIVKRVIAVQNDTVKIEDGVVFVNGVLLQEDYTTGISNDMPEIKVREDTYFVLGDNRTPGESLDSRTDAVGFVNEYQIQAELLTPLFQVPF